MKNVTKILTAVTLCAALFASDQRINALGGNAAFWPGDEANIAAFPAQMNNHAFVQLTGVGTATDNSADLLFNNGGTTWGFGFSNTGMAKDWFDISWGNGDMGVKVGMINYDNGLKPTTAAPTVKRANTVSGHNLGWGKGFEWGEIGVTMGSESWEWNSDTSDGVDTDGDNVNDACSENGAPTTTGDYSNGSCDNVGKRDVSSMGINFTKAMDVWVFDTLVASYSSSETEYCPLTGSCAGTSGITNKGAETHIKADLVSHMNAGAADVVFAMGLDMADDGGDVKNCTDGCNGAWNSMNSTLGVEANMTDWATLRAGVNYTYNLSSDTDATGNNFSWAWGLGFNWGDFTADYSINDNVFQDPISTITGNDHDAGLTTESITFTYSF